jgi:hypothetical protein
MGIKNAFITRKKNSQTKTESFIKIIQSVFLNLGRRRTQFCNKYLNIKAFLFVLDIFFP